MTQPATTDFNPLAVSGHNQPPATPFEDLVAELNDLYDEAKNFCDGTPIDSQQLADAITELHDKIHECGTRAEKMRVEEKRPLDDLVAAIQTKFHPLIGNTKAGKGKVVLGKEACQSLLTPWRQKVAAEKAAEAARVAAIAEAARLTAQEAIRASSGNLAEREAAESLLQDAKSLERQAGRANKAATTGLGLRTVWSARLVDLEKGLDWYFGERPEEFTALVQRLADEDVRKGVRKIQGFDVLESKVAA